ncbi:DUF1491 family protein [uncultured Cohaesibacter sp.]|uniref:DUF1491 family protein n=1 Tax=uncultured Cohaesibacter sp. TaxID=1002546 RepID=UPI0029C86DB4|nr:DUF1491 family protein [uncultured Cohaesibacter sp.]
MRLTSDLWVSAYLRRRNAKGKPSVLIRRGAKEAGAIFIRVDRLDGTHDLYEPASQLSYSEEHERLGDRLFHRSLEAVSTFDVMDRLEKEAKFDSDFWVVETECAQASSDIMLADD